MREFFITGEAMARQACQTLIGHSAYFEFTPWPDDVWRFVVKDEPQLVAVFEPEDDAELVAAYITAAKDHRLVSDGELEVDDSAIVSMGDDPGAYVQAWLWVEQADLDD